VAVSQRVVLARDGSTVSQCIIPQVLSSWSRLYALLLAVFNPRQYVQGAAVSQVRQSAYGVTVLCEDGRSFEADLVVASDGIRSAVRAQLAPEVQAEYAGYVLGAASVMNRCSPSAR